MKDIIDARFYCGGSSNHDFLVRLKSVFFVYNDYQFV